MTRERLEIYIHTYTHTPAATEKKLLNPKQLSSPFKIKVNFFLKPTINFLFTS